MNAMGNAMSPPADLTILFFGGGPINIKHTGNILTVFCSVFVKFQDTSKYFPTCVVYARTYPSLTIDKNHWKTCAMTIATVLCSSQ